MHTYLRKLDIYGCFLSLYVYYNADDIQHVQQPKTSTDAYMSVSYQAGFFMLRRLDAWCLHLRNYDSLCLHSGRSKHKASQLVSHGWFGCH